MCVICICFSVFAVGLGWMLELAKYIQHSSRLDGRCDSLAACCALSPYWLAGRKWESMAGTCTPATSTPQTNKSVHRKKNTKIIKCISIKSWRLWPRYFSIPLFVCVCFFWFICICLLFILWQNEIWFRFGPLPRPLLHTAPIPRPAFFAGSHPIIAAAVVSFRPIV